MSINRGPFFVEPSAHDESFVFGAGATNPPELNYVYHLFFVKVPDHWTLPVDRVYVLAAVYQNPFLYSAVLRAFDEDFAVTHLEEAFGTILHTAPEFDVSSEMRDEFPTSLAQDEKFEASKISVDLGQQIEKISLVAIKTNGGGDWRGEGLFYSSINGYSYNHSDAFIDAKQALRTKLKGEGTPMFARGALYQWALLSVAGVLDSLDPSKILPGKSFSLIDGWTGHVKLTPDDIEYLESLATDDESKAAVAKMKGGECTINSKDMDVANTAKYNPDRPMNRIKTFLVTSYKLTMLSKLNEAQRTGKVKRIGHRLKNEAFSFPTIYDCYQEIDPVNSDDTETFYATGPLYVGSSFNDRTLLKNTFV